MKFNRKTSLKLISATAMAIFSLVVSFSGAIAWLQATRNVDNSGNNFKVDKIGTTVQSITIHEFYGESTDEDYYCFNPVGNSAYPVESGSVELRPYTQEAKHHPVLIMFGVSGQNQTITFKTDFSFLGNTSSYNTEDTKPTYNDLIGDASIKVSGNNNKYYAVTNDAQHGGVSTIYQYKHATETFEMVWVQIGNSNSGKTNPMSSAVNFHSVTFSSLDTSSRSLERETYEGDQIYTYETQSLSCISIAKDDINAGNEKSFTNFSDATTYDYSKEVVVYNGSVAGLTYIGIIVDYDEVALSYIFSQYLGNAALDYDLDFVCDWTTAI